MKHAMSAVEFKTQIEELRPLISPKKAKVILLGRPSAFLSHEEQYEILQGARRLGPAWRRLPDWPQFNEYDLLGFTPEERKNFVRRYLEYNGSRQTTPTPRDWIAKRIDEVNTLADQDPDIFEKPVHAKILTDLATDRQVDLGFLRGNLTRWHLYKAFFSALAERENQKDARRAMRDDRRINFLRDLAFWLWTQKSGATAFSIHELPESLFERAYAADEDFDIKATKREFLAGPFLEKKTGATYYFSHRSFAEFLVAEYMTLHPPSGQSHQLYSQLCTSGVLAFLQDAPAEAGVQNWAETLGGAVGLVSIEYIAFLVEMAHQHRASGIELPHECTLRAFLTVLPQLGATSTPTAEAYLQLLRHNRNAVFLNAIWGFRRFIASQYIGKIVKDKPVPKDEIDLEVIAALFDRVFQQATVDKETGTAYIPSTSQEALKLAQILRIEVLSDYDRMLVF